MDIGLGAGDKLRTTMKKTEINEMKEESRRLGTKRLGGPTPW